MQAILKEIARKIAVDMYGSEEKAGAVYEWMSREVKNLAARAQVELDLDPEMSIVGIQAMAESIRANGLTPVGVKVPV